MKPHEKRDHIRKLLDSFKAKFDRNYPICEWEEDRDEDYLELKKFIENNEFKYVQGMHKPNECKTFKETLYECRMIICTFDEYFEKYQDELGEIEKLYKMLPTTGPNYSLIEGIIVSITHALMSFYMSVIKYDVEICEMLKEFKIYELHFEAKKLTSSFRESLGKNSYDEKFGGFKATRYY